jgi:hypothetical protein
VAGTPTARERKLVEEGAKGVAERWTEGGPGDGAVKGAQFRSSVRKIAGKPEDLKARGADPEARPRQRATRAGQAAAGMLSPPPGTFDEAALRDWLKKMKPEDLAKLSRLVSFARNGREGDRGNWNKVERSMHVEVHGGTVNISTAPTPSSYQAQSSRGWGEKNDRYSNNWGRHLSRLKDFING